MTNPIVFRFARHIIAFIVIAGSFAFLFALLRWAVPAENREMLQLAQGFVLSLSGIVVGYYFGTSKDKSDADQAARTEGTTTTTSTIKTP